MPGRYAFHTLVLVILTASALCSFVSADTVYVETTWRAAPNVATMDPREVTLRLTGPDTVQANVPFDLILEINPEGYESEQVGIEPDMTATLLYDDALTSVSYLPIQYAFYRGGFNEMSPLDFWEAADHTSRLRIDEILALRTMLEDFSQSGSFIWNRYTHDIEDAHKRYYVMNFINDYDFFTLPTREPPDELLPSAMRYKIPLKMADRSSPVRVVFSEFSLSGFGCTWTFPKLTLVFNPEEPIEGRLATPELQSPADSSLNPDRPIRFAWSDVEGVEEYGIWCSVGDTTVTIYTGQSPFLTIAQWYWENMPDATYFWWVTAKGGTGQSEQSEIWTFTKRSENDANVPEQLSPEDGIINPDTPFTLSWAESPGVPTYTIRFTMPGSDDFMYFDTDGTELVVDQALWDGLPEGALFWQVKPATGYGAASFCGRRSFIKRPVDCTNDIDMISIPAGTFQMGSPEDEFGRDAPEGPMHTVNISAFEMSSTPITRKQWRDTMGWLEGGDDPWETDNHPVDSVTWYDAAAFCNKLSEIEGLTKCYTMSDVRYDQPQHHIGYAEVSCDWSANGYRLATEAEWEYACRAGTTTRYYSGDSVFDLDCVGWYMCNSGLRMQPVAAKEPNAFGLYDMHGQDWEWCWDWLSYNYYSESPTQDPRGPDTGDYGEFKKIHRGGARQRRAWNCRSAKRYSHSPATRGSYIIFRIARSGG